MIVVDTSAIVAVLLEEEGSDEVAHKLTASTCVMSAATRVELGIVIEAGNGPAGSQLLEELLDRIEVGVEPVDAADAQNAIVAWRRFGRGRHPAALNYGDIFAYVLAKRLSLPLLFAGGDFAQTDVEVA